MTHICCQAFGSGAIFTNKICRDLESNPDFARAQKLMRSYTFIISKINASFYLRLEIIMPFLVSKIRNKYVQHVLKCALFVVLLLNDAIHTDRSYSE